MEIWPMHHRLARLSRPLIAAACALVACGAQAQSNPFYFRASETLSYDSNLFRVPDKALLPAGIHGRDGISSTELTVGLDQPYGRQRWLASAGVNANVFKNNDQLNNTGYDLLLGLDWQALSRWAGDVRLTSSQQLASFENYGAQFVANTDKNMEQVNTLSARAQYGLVSLWSLEGTFVHRDVNFSNDSFTDREYRQDQLGFGVNYRPSDLLRLGAAVRHTDGQYPHATTTGPDKYKRDDVDLTATWKASGLSTLDGRISATHENHDLIDARDFSGVTGSLGWNYRPTGKTTVDLRLSRDTGTRGNGAPPALDPAATAAYLTDSRLSDRIDANVRWEATSKITLRGAAGYSNDRYDQQFIAPFGTIVTGDTGHTRNFLVGVSYQATRAWTLGCEAGRRSRSTPVFIGGVGYSYDAHVASCSVSLLLE
jgi:hypothetical protein